MDPRTRAWEPRGAHQRSCRVRLNLSQRLDVVEADFPKKYIVPVPFRREESTGDNGDDGDEGNKEVEEEKNSGIRKANGKSHPSQSQTGVGAQR